MIRVLTIGNSFADDATRYIEEIARADDVELLIGKANLGGCSLEKHWNLVEQCDLLPDIKPYNFYLTGAGTREAALKEILKSEKWDFITLQQVSDLSWRAETYHPFIDNLYSLVSEFAPQAEKLLHQTWAYRVDANELKKYEISQTEMFSRLKKAYSEAASKYRCRIIPSGEAFQNARAVFKYKPDTSYDFVDPKPLELPDQSKSLIIGYFWKTGNTATGKAEFSMDGRHGNAKGRYLANAVWYEALTGKNLTNNTFCPAGVTADELEILKSAAHETVALYNTP